MVSCIVVNSSSFASTCPDPETSSLKWGVIPEPWLPNPFSANSIQIDETTHFTRANILVTNSYGQGILCTYKMSQGEYSIWWPVLSKVPAPIDYHWINTPGGFVCTQSLNECQFVVAA